MLRDIFRPKGHLFLAIKFVMLNIKEASIYLCFLLLNTSIDHNKETFSDL